MYRRILILIAASMMIVPSSHAMYIRLLTPASASISCPEINGEVIKCSPKSSGYALRGIFGLFGLGYASSTLDVGPDASSTTIETWKVTANAVDLSLSFLDALVTVGVGSVIGGNEEMTNKSSQTQGDYYYNITQVVTDSKQSGSTSFLNFGFGIGPVELIAGYRMWNVKSSDIILAQTTATNFPGASSGTETGTMDSGTRSWSEVSVGVGFGF